MRLPFCTHVLSLSLFIQRHGIAQIFPGIRNPAAHEADKLRMFRQLFDFIESFRAGKYAQMATVFAAANFFRHAFSLISKLFYSCPSGNPNYSLPP
jgi:hypothetical protein